MSSFEPPVAQRAARAARRGAHAHRGRAHVRGVQPAVPRAQDVAVLVQRVRGQQRLQRLAHAAHVPDHVLQLRHQSAAVRVPVEELPKRYAGIAVL